MNRFLIEIYRQVLHFADDRVREYKFAQKNLGKFSRVLDLGSGTGTFLEFIGEKAVGLEFNLENVEYCQNRNLNVVHGDARSIPFNNDTFDAVFCSHLLQVFSPNEIASVFKEINRVLKPNGRLVISTLNDFSNFWQHPENVRPYPPDAIRRLFESAAGAQSPMFGDFPNFREINIRLRKPVLFELRMRSHKKLSYLASFLNALQNILRLRKFWKFNAYTICFEKYQK